MGAPFPSDVPAAPGPGAFLSDQAAEFGLRRPICTAGHPLERFAIENNDRASVGPDGVLAGEAVQCLGHAGPPVPNIRGGRYSTSIPIAAAALANKRRIVRNRTRVPRLSPSMPSGQ